MSAINNCCIGLICAKPSSQGNASIFIVWCLESEHDSLVRAPKMCLKCSLFELWAKELTNTKVGFK